MRLLILSLLVSTVVACTPPTQRVAATALILQNREYARIHAEHMVQVKQATEDVADAKIRKAVAAGDADAASWALQDFADDLKQIHARNIDFVKTRWGATGLVAQFIWQQAGVADLFSREWARAEANARAATQPSKEPDP